MDNIIVAFWSQTGNTESMAKAIGEGITSSGKKAEVLNISMISPQNLKENSVFALGCPATGKEVLETGQMEPFVKEIEKFASGKQIALFGSYGWGGGQWMRDWEERMSQAGAIIVNGEGLICQKTPDENILEQCRAIGKQLASL